MQNFGHPKLSYKVKVFNASKRSKFTVRQLHHYSEQFTSLVSMRGALSNELGDDVPDDSEFAIGYFEGRHQTKRWLVTNEDLKVMYEKCKQGEIFLWCDGRAKEPEKDDSSSRKRKSSSSRQEKELEVDDIYEELREKHGDVYSGPQLRLWARMIIAGTHDDKDNPPRVPMITGTVAKRPKQESLADALAGAATVIVKAFGGTPVPSAPGTSTTPTAACVSTTGVSPGKSADLRMKNLQQLRFLQQLLEDRVIDDAEFMEQKRITLDALRKLS